MFVGWADRRDWITAQDVFLLRFTGNGDIASAWPSNGLLICGARFDQSLRSIVAYDDSSVFLAWLDHRRMIEERRLGWDVYIQKALGSGSIAGDWPVDGVPVFRDTVNGDASLLPDGDGGVFVTWIRSVPFDGWRIGLQHVTHHGVIAAGWPDTGITVCNADAQGLTYSFASDGRGGILAAWAPRTEATLRVQRLTAAGLPAPGWPDDGLVVCQAAGTREVGVVVPLDDGGGIIAWRDRRSGDWDVYAARVSGNGAFAQEWPVNGLLICGAPGDQWQPSGCPDGNGGAFLAWADRRSGDWDTYVQHLSAAGSIPPGWASGGQPVSIAPRSQFSPWPVSDGTGGVVLTWSDFRADTTGSRPNLYAHRLTAAGEPASGWQQYGTPVRVAPTSISATGPVADGAGGILVGWVDYNQSSVTSRVYVQRVAGDGRVAPVVPPPVDRIRLDWAQPNPTRAGAAAVLELATAADVIVTVVDLSGRRIRRLYGGNHLPAGRHRLDWDGYDSAGRRARPGLYYFAVVVGERGLSVPVVVLE
jgi:hypothetical protein